MKKVWYFLLMVLFAAGCKSESKTSKTTTNAAKAAKSGYKTENVIIILIDGPRYSETWGDPTHQYIKGLDAMSHEGIVLTEFYNDGVTATMNGHDAITTGVYEDIDNTGAEVPTNPSLFQLYLEKTKSAAADAWIISSKDKLQTLSDCKQTSYKGKYIPRTDCGTKGLASEIRDDSITYKNAVATLTAQHPHLAFISFKEPDIAGHAANWPGYLSGLKQSDHYAYALWQVIQNDPQYKDKTTVFITNDHGRNLDGAVNGFASHGDTCLGCRHIMLLAAGPDFKKDAVITGHYGLTDINATAAELLGIKTQGKGKVIRELFQ